MPASRFELIGERAAPVSVSAPFAACGGVIIRNALSSSRVAWEAQQAARKLLENPTSLRERFLYDPKRRVGYTPPGVEGTKRSGPNESRHFFNYRPGDLR